MFIGGMRRAIQLLLAGNVLLSAVFLSSCETMPQGIQQARIEMAQRIAAEPTGDYFIGRRYYKPVLLQISEIQRAQSICVNRRSILLKVRIYLISSIDVIICSDKLLSIMITWKKLQATMIVE